MRRICIIILPLLLISSYLLYDYYIHYNQSDGKVKDNILPKGIDEITLGMNFSDFTRLATFKFKLNEPMGSSHFYDNQPDITYEANNVKGFSIIYFTFIKRRDKLVSIEGYGARNSSNIDDFNKVVKENMMKYGKKPHSYIDSGYRISEWQDSKKSFRITYDPPSNRIIINYDILNSPRF